MERKGVRQTNRDRGGKGGGKGETGVSGRRGGKGVGCRSNVRSSSFSYH